MEPKRTVSLPHPIVDESGPGWVASYSSAPLVGLSSGREALFVDATRAGTRVVIVTAPTSRISFALYQLLTVLGGVWLTRDGAGVLRHAVGGEVVRSYASLVEPDYEPLSGETLDERLGGIAERVEPDDLRPWLQFTVAVHHPARAETSLGGAMQTLVESVTGEAPAAWGTSEPVTVPWDRSRLTALSRARMPQDSRVYVNGTAVNGTARDIRYSGSIRSFRSDIGVTEETRIVFSFPGDASPIDSAADLCTRLAEREQVLMATAWSMRGGVDATIPPYWPTSPQPLAAVIGARAVRSMELDTGLWELEHNARVTGNRRTPSLVIDFGADDVRWRRFAGAFDTVGAETLAAVLTPPSLSPRSGMPRTPGAKGGHRAP